MDPPPSAAAQSQSQSLTVDPSSVPEAGTYDFTLTPSGFTASNINLAVCNTGDPSVEWGQATLLQYCGGFGQRQDALSGAFTIEDVEVGQDGVTFILLELAADGEYAIATVNVEGSGSAAAQSQSLTVDPSSVPEAGTYDFTLTPSGFTASNINLVVCNTGDPSVEWGGATLLQYCGGFGQRQDALSGAFTIEGVEVGQDGVTFILLELAADGEGAIATVNVDGRVSGRFVDPTGGPVPSGDYVLTPDGHTLYPLSVDPQTGTFTSPEVATGQYTIAYGNLGTGFLNNNAAATVEVVAGQTTDAGTIELQRSGAIGGTVSDSSAQGLGGIIVKGMVLSQSSSLSMPPSPFVPNGVTEFTATTSNDGTYSAHSLVPDEEWKITFSDPTGTYPDQSYADPTVAENRYSQFTAIATVSEHSCAIRADQSIVCWGRNDYGQADAPIGQFTTISVASLHSCAIRADQSIVCWGRNDYGQADAPIGQFTAISAIGSYSCAIRVDQTVACWGYNGDGQADAPAGQYTAISGGGRHSCAINTDNVVVCWGANEYGQTDAPAGQHTAVAAGRNYTCAIKADQSVVCWGANENGQTDAPAGQFTAIAAYGPHSCAIKADQSVACWPYTSVGLVEASDGPYTAIAVGFSYVCALRADQTIDCRRFEPLGPADVPGDQYAAIAVGTFHSCAIKTDQSIECWGTNRNGQTIAPTGQYIDVGVGLRHSCALRVDQTVACWGYNGDGRANAPAGQYTAISVGSGHSCALGVDRNVACWGYNGEGRADAPAGQYTAVSAGERHSCAINTDKVAVCWGDNSREQTDVPAGQYTAVAAGSHHTCAIHVDRTAECWGSLLGLFSLYPPDGQYTAIETSAFHSCAFRPDQTISCWGMFSNFNWEDVPDGQYTSVSIASSYACATRADQTAVCWEAETVVPPNPAVEFLTGIFSPIAVGSGETVTIDWQMVSEDTARDTTPEDDAAGDEAPPAERCFAVHKFGAQPVDVAKTAGGDTVLAQLSWGFHESIGCYLTLDEAALAVLRAAPAPLGFPAGDPGAAQQCSEIHKFGAQPVDVAKSADRQTVLAQVRWGFHQSIGCFLALDTASTAALRAAHTQ